MVCRLAVLDKPATCRLNQVYAGKTQIATSNLLVLLLVAVPVACIISLSDFSLGIMQGQLAELLMILGTDVNFG